MFAFAFLMWLLPVVFVVAVGVRAIWACVTRPKKWKAEPSCERCGYTVIGLTSFACPECGADLRRTGIITPAMELRRRGSLTWAIAAWTVSIFVLSYFALGAWTVLFGYSATMAASAANSVTTTLTETYVPDSKGFAEVRVISSQTVGGMRSEHVSLEIIDLEGKSASILAQKLGTFWTLGANNPSIDLTAETKLRAEVVKAVMVSASIPAAYPGVDGDIADIVSLMNEKISNMVSPVPASTVQLSALQRQGTSTNTLSPPPAPTNLYIVPIVGGMIAICLWLAGVVFIVRMRQGMLRLANQFEREAA